MRIAFVTFEYPPFTIGGAGVYALNVTHELANLGHHVIVFTPRINDSEEKEQCVNNLEVRRTELNKRLPLLALQFWLRLPKVVKKAENEGKFDIIHFNSISYWFFKKKLSEAPHVVTVHHLVKDAIRNNNLSLISRLKDTSGENNLFIPFIEKRYIRFADKIIAVSDFTKKQIIKTYRAAPDKIKVVCNGTDLNVYAFTEEELEEVKKQLNLINKPIILFVGRVDDPRKGLDLLLKALKKVLEKIDAVLLVVGKGNQTEAIKLAKSLGVFSNVIFTGFADNSKLKKLYLLCDIYVCPSRLEGFGLTILEAMAAGKPIVATNVGAISEIIKNMENGTLVEPGDIDRMSNAICTFLKDKTFSESVGKINENYIKEQFSWEKNAKKTEDVYMQLIGK